MHTDVRIVIVPVDDAGIVEVVCKSRKTVGQRILHILLPYKLAQRSTCIHFGSYIDTCPVSIDIQYGLRRGESSTLQLLGIAVGSQPPVTFPQRTYTLKNVRRTEPLDHQRTRPERGRDELDSVTSLMKARTFFVEITDYA